MQEGYYIGAYWGPRKETAQECARRMERFLRLLAKCDPSFIQWYRGGRGYPRGSPGFPVSVDVMELEQLLLKTRNRTDIGKRVIEELGFSRNLWTANRGATDLSLACGGYSPWVTNYCLFKPTRENPVRERILRPSVQAEVLTSMVTAWDPEFAMASSSEMVDLVEKDGFEVRLGWLTYLSRSLGRLPPLPAPVSIEPIGESGWLLRLSPEPMTASNSEHVAFTLRVRELLDRAGLIQRPKPEPLGY